MTLKTITKEFNFCYAHRLVDYKFSEEKNKEVFGKCFEDNHGHNGKLFVTVSTCAEYFGMIINFTELKRIVNHNIIEILDHHNLNNLKMFEGKITTCENVIEWIWNELDKVLPKELILERLKLYETDTSFCELER